ncbi:MAG: HemD protein, partial [Desulfobulbus sp.]
AGIRPPALVIVGEVVKLRKSIDWFETRPLFGKRMVITRTRAQASELVAQLEEYGAECLEYSTIHIEPVDDYQQLDQALERIKSYDWILFTSLNAITYFFKRLNATGRDSRALASCCVGAVGRATAEALMEYGIRADLVPEKFTGEGLAESLIKNGVQKSRILLPRALKAMETLPEMLDDAGAEVTVAPVYQNVPPQGRKEELREELAKGEIDLVTFTSSSTVTNFLTMVDAADKKELDKLLTNVRIAAIGPITAETVTRNGLKVDIQPDKYTITDMAAAIVDHYRDLTP